MGHLSKSQKTRFFSNVRNSVPVKETTSNSLIKANLFLKMKVLYEEDEQNVDMN